MEIVILLGILGVFFLGPLAIALIALAQVRGLRNRLDDVDRFASLMREHRLSERMNRLKVQAVPPPPLVVESARPKPVEVASTAPFVHPRVLRPAPSPAQVASPLKPIQPRILKPEPEPEPVKAPEERVPLENLIGERILPRIGVIAIVLGMSLLVWYSITHLGPAGKITLAGATGAAMVVGGAVLRRRDHFKLLGSCLIGGGWAVMYIAAYAAHAVEASRIISVENKLLGFLVLFAVSEAALAHALKYKSETIAGLAYLLTIVSLFLSPEPGPPAWVAIGLSGAVLVALAWWQRWIRLCTFGAALLYVAEGVWLAGTPPASMLPALGVLVALWVLWTLPDYFHRPAARGERIIHGLLVAINFIGVLIVGALIQKWFSLRYMGWVWFTLGSLYAIHAFAGRKAAWRFANHAALLFAAILLGVAAHQFAAGLGAVIAWMGISAALIAWGLWRKDPVPRAMGIAGLIVSAGRVWAGDWRMEHAWIPALIVAALFYAVAAMVSRLKRTGQAGKIESGSAVLLSHLAAVSLGLVLWHHPPELASGALFALTGFALLVIGPRLGARELVAEGVCYLTVAAFFVAAQNLTASGDFLFMSRRLASTVPVLLAWLGARLLLPRMEKDGENLGRFFSVLLMAGLLAFLGFELGMSKAPVAWAIACGAVYLWSRVSGRDFEFLVATVGAAATVVAYCVGSTLQVPIAGWEGAAASGSLIMGLFVAIHLASDRGAGNSARSAARDVLGAAIAVTGFALLARELSGMELTASWAILGFALSTYGVLARDRVSRWTSFLVLAAGLVHVVAIDVPQAAVTWALVSGAWFLWSRVAKRDLEFGFATVGAAGAVLLYAAAPALLMPAVDWSGPVASGAILAAIFIAIHIASRNAPPFFRDAFAAAIALTAFTLLARELDGTWLTGSWAVLGFALAAYGFLVRDRVSRWSSLLVLGVCLGKVVLFDLATFEMPVKIATLITLGTVMVTLSFVYARHHRRIVVYLAGREQ